MILMRREIVLLDRKTISQRILSFHIVMLIDKGRPRRNPARKFETFWSERRII